MLSAYVSAQGRSFRNFPNSSMRNQRTPPSSAFAPSYRELPLSFLCALYPNLLVDKLQGMSSIAQQGWP